MTDTNVKTEPCGCMSKTNEDGEVGHAPCAGHAMKRIADGLAFAAQNLVTLGDRLLAEHKPPESKIIVPPGPRIVT